MGYFTKKFYINSNEYYDDKIAFNKILEIQKPRCIIIRNYENISIVKQVNDFCKLGFKNIIVCQNNKKYTMYNIVNYKKYLHDNKDILIKCIKEENHYEPKNWERAVGFDDAIFYMQNLMFLNFLKWCCIK
jgi:hypothetical protein